MKLLDTSKYFNDADLLSKRYRVGINLLSKEGLKEYFFNFRKIDEEELEAINKYVTENKCSILSSPYDMYGFDGDYIDYLHLTKNEEEHKRFFEIGEQIYDETEEELEIPF